jgi:hypothetical protein
MFDMKSILGNVKSQLEQGLDKKIYDFIDKNEKKENAKIYVLLEPSISKENKPSKPILTIILVSETKTTPHPDFTRKPLTDLMKEYGGGMYTMAMLALGMSNEKMESLILEHLFEDENTYKKIFLSNKTDYTQVEMRFFDTQTRTTIPEESIVNDLKTVLIDLLDLIEQQV